MPTMSAHFTVGGVIDRDGNVRTSHMLSTGTQQMHLVGIMTALVSADLRTCVYLTPDGPCVRTYESNQRFCVLPGIGVVECKPHTDCPLTPYECGKRVEIEGPYSRLFVGPTSVCMTPDQRSRLLPNWNIYGHVVTKPRSADNHIYVWLFVVRPCGGSWCGRVDQVIAVMPVAASTNACMPRGVVAVEDVLVHSFNHNNANSRISGCNMRSGGRWVTRTRDLVELVARTSGAVADAKTGECIHYSAANEELWLTFPESYRAALGKLPAHKRELGPTARSVISHAGAHAVVPVQLLQVHHMEDGELYALTLSYVRTDREGDVAVDVYEFAKTRVHN